MNWKSFIITLIFIVSFAFGAWYFIEPEIKIYKQPAFLGPGYKSIPELSTTKFIQVEYSDYIKTISGAAIGWCVKEICTFLLGLIKNLIKKGV